MVAKITGYTPTEDDMKDIDDFTWTPAEVTQKIFECVDGDIKSMINTLRSVQDTSSLTSSKINTDNKKNFDEYILYKDPVMKETLDIVQYLHFLGYPNVEPKMCIERDYPDKISIIPSIECIHSGKIYHGLSQCIEYYITKYQIPMSEEEFLRTSINFKLKNPEYRIHN